MKRFILAAVLVVSCLGVSAQNKASAVDTAQRIVERYLRLMNFDGVKRDSILYIETIAYKRSSPGDTAVLKRWFLYPNCFRAELWHGDTLLEGAYTDGKEIYREYRLGVLDGWTRVAQSRYYVLEPGYDFRGSLYHWKADAAELTYKGEWDYNGQKVHRVYVDTPMRYCRNYLFEKESGMLFLIEETNKHSEYTDHAAYDHPDWHAFSEYQPLGGVLLPSVEVYQMKGDLVFHFSTGRYIPKDMNIFRKN